MSNKQPKVGVIFKSYEPMSSIQKLSLIHISEPTRPY